MKVEISTKKYKTVADYSGGCFGDKVICDGEKHISVTWENCHHTSAYFDSHSHSIKVVACDGKHHAEEGKANCIHDDGFDVVCRHGSFENDVPKLLEDIANIMFFNKTKRFMVPRGFDVMRIYPQGKHLDYDEEE